MSKVMEIFFTDEVADMINMSKTHIYRLIKKGMVDLAENEDYRIGNKGQYLFTDTAVEKLLAYKKSRLKSRF